MQRRPQLQGSVVALIDIEGRSPSQGSPSQGRDVSNRTALHPELTYIARRLTPAQEEFGQEVRK
jgi:hypothetical protein